MNYELALPIACMMVILHRTPLYKRLLEALLIDVKPFTCVLCSTFWYSVFPLAFTIGWESIFISSIAAVLAELLDIQLDKL